VDSFETLLQVYVNGLPLCQLLGRNPDVPGDRPPHEQLRALSATEISVGYCFVCGQRAAFFSFEPIDYPCKRNTFICQSCGSCSRNRHLAKCILERITTDRPSRSLRQFATNFQGKIYLTCTSGAIASALKDRPASVASEYFEGVQSGAGVNGILCEDLQATSFADNTFDLVITEEVMEHVAEPGRAFAEIRRILKPGGFHVATIPLNWEREMTVARATVVDGQIRHILEPEYHGDPTRPEGILAFTEYGRDIIDWCSIVGPSWIDAAHQDVLQETAFGIYNNWVFLSQKLS
jgi:SAM-dependent methyltransferase